MPMTPEAAKQYKPRRTPGSLDDVIYPETRAKMEEAKAAVADRKAAADNEAAYNKASGLKKGGMTASKRGDGIATKGKTRGTMITMCGGGMSKRK
jgi:hypothetical protein